MIRVVVDDLAFLSVDAIIRPANDRLEPVTPAMAQLDRAGGEGFAKQRRLQQPLDVGAAVVTGAGDLAAKFVIHAVIQGDSGRATRDSVRRALVSAWQRAGDWALESVATPLVGAGAGQLPLEEAATILVETLAEERARAGQPGEVQVVVEHEAEMAMVEAVVARRVP